jgi:hypothetical protein
MIWASFGTIEHSKQLLLHLFFGSCFFPCRQRYSQNGESLLVQSHTTFIPRNLMAADEGRGTLHASDGRQDSLKDAATRALLKNCCRCSQTFGSMCKLMKSCCTSAKHSGQPRSFICAACSNTSRSAQPHSTPCKRVGLSTAFRLHLQRLCLPIAQARHNGVARGVQHQNLMGGKAGRQMPVKNVDVSAGEMICKRFAVMQQHVRLIGLMRSRALSLPSYYKRKQVQVSDLLLFNL